MSLCHVLDWGGGGGSLSFLLIPAQYRKRQSVETVGLKPLTMQQRKIQIGSYRADYYNYKPSSNMLPLFVWLV